MCNLAARTCFVAEKLNVFLARVDITVCHVEILNKFLITL